MLLCNEGAVRDVPDHTVLWRGTRVYLECSLLCSSLRIWRLMLLFISRAGNSMERLSGHAHVSMTVCPNLTEAVDRSASPIP
jgi:hypothetical protein